MKKMLIPVLIFFLFMPIAFADGIYIPPDYHHWQNMVEHHQIATVDFNPDEDIATVHLFISVEDLTGEGGKIKWGIPFEDKPFGLNASDITLGDFEKDYKVNSTESLISDINQAKQARYKYSRALNDFVKIFFFSPFFDWFTPYRPMGGVATKQMYESAPRAPGWVLSEVQQFGSTRVLVYHIFSEQGASHLVEHVGLDESVLRAFRKYDDTYLYVIELEPKSMVSGETKSYLGDVCPNSYSSFLVQLQSKYRRYSKDQWTAQCINECKDNTPNCDYVEIEKAVEDIIDSALERPELEENGVVVTYKVPMRYEDGKYKFWYPLGTGEAWSKPIDDVRVYAFVPYDYKTYGLYPNPQINETMNQWTYVWRYRNTKPSNDLQITLTKATQEEKNNMISYVNRKMTQIDLASNISDSSMTFAVIFFLISWFFVFLVLNKNIFKNDFGFESLKDGVVTLGAYMVGAWGIGITIIGAFVAPLVGIGLAGYWMMRKYGKKKSQKIFIFIVLQFVLTFILFMIISRSIYWWLGSLVL